MAVAAAIVVAGCSGGAGFAAASTSGSAPTLTEVPGAKPDNLDNVKPGEPVEVGRTGGTDTAAVAR
ncbi:hypothetical protein ABZ471_00305 [Streptomyces sp. NPDC005728]|uniref:hypothetical protein n=1 Tax=Streptomyces sp. NPDC005728 TaxID=3157054 RepID=UPI0033F2993A